MASCGKTHEAKRGRTSVSRAERWSRLSEDRTKRFRPTKAEALKMAYKGDLEFRVNPILQDRPHVSYQTTTAPYWRKNLKFEMLLSAPLHQESMYRNEGHYSSAATNTTTRRTKSRSKRKPHPTKDAHETDYHETAESVFLRRNTASRNGRSGCSWPAAVSNNNQPSLLILAEYFALSAAIYRPFD